MCFSVYAILLEYFNMFVDIEQYLAITFYPINFDPPS